MSNKPLNTEDKHLVMGRFGAPFGVKGWIKLQSYCQHSEDLLAYTPHLLKQKDGSYVSIEITEHQINHKGIVVRCAGYEDRTAIETLRNHYVYIEASSLDECEEDEYYWFELTGMQVVNQTHESLGTVKSVMATAGNDILVVQHPEKALLIPFIQPLYIKSIDREQRQIVADWQLDYL